jgi:hypothetical protein
MAEPRIPFSRDAVIAFCEKYGVAEFALFGSVLRDDFRPDSDVDVLVAFKPDSPGITLENMFDMQDELEAIFGRKVDLVERRRVTNPFRRHEIITTRRVIHAA